MEPLFYDLRFALRAIRRRPGFALTAVVSLSIAIAATTSVFSIVNAALLKDVPGVSRPERLVEISRDVGGEATDVTFQVFRLLREQRDLLSDLAALALAPASISVGGEPSVRGSLAVTASYFDLLGVTPIRGRLFTTGEAEYPNIAPVVLLSHDVWRRELGAAEDVIGRTVHMNGRAVQVVGVLPPNFAGHHTGLLIDIFLPLGLALPGLPNPRGFETPNGSSIELLGRLRPGVARSLAQQELSAVADRYARTTGEATSQRPYALRVDAWGPLPGAIRPAVAAFLTLLLGLVALALVMACVNISTVLLARSAERQRELAVRRAIGARQGRIVRQIMTEVAVLFVIAGVAAVFVSVWATSLIHGFTPPVPIPGRLGADLSFDVRVLGFALAVTLGASAAFSFLPAFQASRGALVSALREAASTESRGRARLRAMMVAAQVAVTSVLLCATLLFGRALSTMRALQPSWNPAGVFVTQLNLELNGTTREQGVEFQKILLARLTEQPTLENAALASKLPIGGRSSLGLVHAPDGATPTNGLPGWNAALNRVSRGYFSTLQIPLLRGRDFLDSDGDGTPLVAVVSATMARNIWGERNPVGATFYVGSGESRRDFTVVGVVADAQLTPPGRAPDNFYYVPLAQWYNPDVSLHVRGRPGLDDAMLSAVRVTVREIDASLPLPALRPLRDALGIYLLPQRLAAAVAAAMGIFGLLLATVGIYGVTSFVTSRRAREFAIRMALGATPRHVARLVLWQGGRAPLVGMLLGLTAAFAFSLFIGKVVVGVQAGDPAVFVSVPAVLATVALAAMLAPVRLLLRTSPMARLREE